MKGTARYLAPELWVIPTPYSVKSDMWSMGCVLRYVCALKPAVRVNNRNHEISNKVCSFSVFILFQFPAEEEHELAADIAKKACEPIPVDSYDANLQDLVSNLLRKEPG